MFNHTTIEKSLWKNSVQPFLFPQLDENINVDVLIIGGGFTGCSAALHLARNNVSVALIEAKEIGNGASGRNVGLINPVSWLSPNVFAQNLGQNGVAMLKELSNAQNQVYALIKKYEIDNHLSLLYLHIL